LAGIVISLGGLAAGSVFLVVGLLAVMALAIAMNGGGTARLTWFFLAGSLYALPMLYKVIGLNLVNSWQFPVLLLAAFGIPALLREAARDGLLIAALVCWLCFVLWALVSGAVAGRGETMAMGYQLFSDFKPVCLLALGLVVARWDRHGDFVRLIWTWAWPVLVVLVLVQWVTPGVYGKVFPFPHAPVPEPGIGLPSRAFGWFEHSGMLAGFSATMSIVTVSRLVWEKQRQPWTWAIGAAYVGLLLASGGRGEFAAVVVALFAFYILSDPRQVVFRLAAATPLFVVGGLVFWTVYGDSISREVMSWGGSKVGAIQHPRAQLYEAAVYLANTNWPFGSGLGTYGGAGSVKFDQSLYYEVGLAYQWWFRKQDFLLDIYWHNAVGEAGWLGAGSLFLHYVFLMLAGLRRFHRAEGVARSQVAIFVIGMLYLMTNSLASPSFQDPRLMFIPALMFGLALVNGRRST
jgi:hypothetical protein